MVQFNSSKPIYFQMISDNRFDKDIKKKINSLHKRVMAKLKDKDKFKVTFNKTNLITFREGKDKQYRVRYKVYVNKKKAKLNDLYVAVNSVKAVPYSNTP